MNEIKKESISTHRYSFWNDVARRAIEVRFKDQLIAAIITRRYEDINYILKNPQKITQTNDNLIVTQKNYSKLAKYFGSTFLKELLQSPIKLAFALYSNKNALEVTDDIGIRRYHMLHILAQHYDQVTKCCGRPYPNLEEIIAFACQLKNDNALNVFLNGLSPKNRKIANSIMEHHHAIEQNSPANNTDNANANANANATVTFAR